MFAYPSIPNKELDCYKKICVILQEGQEDESLEEEAALSISHEDENNADMDIDSTVISAWNQNNAIKFICY